MEHYKFDCGCKIPILNEAIKANDGLPSLHVPFREIAILLNYNQGCMPTWDLISSGRTKGVFQLESELGQSWSARLKPDSLEEISALISLIRPGCLRAIVDGKSMTQHYVDRKAGIEPVSFFKQELEPILGPTYGVMAYQEQAMRMAVNLAGYNEMEADVLRKAIGKKLPELMAKLKTSFIDGCAKVGILNAAEAEQVFGWIQESQRYSFNKSHGVGYGELGYLTAYAKKHFPLHFFASWLKYARDKMDTQDEIKQLVMDAKSLDIEIRPPSVKTLFDNDYDVCIDKDHINFGIRCIKRIGEAGISKFVKQIMEAENQLKRKVSEWTWLEFLVLIGSKVTSTTFNGIISVGTLGHYGLSRQKMLYDYQTFKQLTDKEQAALALHLSTYRSFEDGLHMLGTASKELGGAATKPRRDKILQLLNLLQNPPHKVEDNAKWIIAQEKELLGTPLSYSTIEAIDSAFVTNTTCREYNDGKNTKNMTMSGEIVKCREWAIKSGNSKGQKMAFLTLEDQTGAADCVMFSDALEQYEDSLYLGNTIAVAGERSKKGSFMITKVFAI